MFVAAVVGGFSVGRLVGGILLGWWFNKRGAKVSENGRAFKFAAEFNLWMSV